MFLALNSVLVLEAPVLRFRFSFYLVTRSSRVDVIPAVDAQTFYETAKARHCVMLGSFRIRKRSPKRFNPMSKIISICFIPRQTILNPRAEILCFQFSFLNLKEIYIIRPGGEIKILPTPPTPYHKLSLPPPPSDPEIEEIPAVYMFTDDLHRFYPFFFYFFYFTFLLEKKNGDAFVTKAKGKYKRKPIV